LHDVESHRLAIFKNYDVMCLSISDYALCTWEC
jgi:hypothetical protein